MQEQVRAHGQPDDGLHQKTVERKEQGRGALRFTYPDELLSPTGTLEWRAEGARPLAEEMQGTSSLMILRGDRISGTIRGDELSSQTEDVAGVRTLLQTARTEGWGDGELLQGALKLNPAVRGPDIYERGWPEGTVGMIVLDPVLPGGSRGELTDREIAFKKAASALKEGGILVGRPDMPLVDKAHELGLEIIGYAWKKFPYVLWREFDETVSNAAVNPQILGGKSAEIHAFGKLVSNWQSPDGTPLEEGQVDPTTLPKAPAYFVFRKVHTSP